MQCFELPSTQTESFDRSFVRHFSKDQEKIEKIEKRRSRREEKRREGEPRISECMQIQEWIANRRLALEIRIVHLLYQIITEGEHHDVVRHRQCKQQKGDLDVSQRSILLFVGRSVDPSIRRSVSLWTREREGKRRQKDPNVEFHVAEGPEGCDVHEEMIDADVRKCPRDESPVLSLKDAFCSS